MKLKRIQLKADIRGGNEIAYQEYIGWHLCTKFTDIIYRKINLYDIHLRAFRKQKVRLATVEQNSKEIIMEVA